MVNFKEIYHFSRFQRGSKIFQGGGSNFSRGGGGGSNCLFPIETHITCDFPGGGGGGCLDPLPPPPSGSALDTCPVVKSSDEKFVLFYFYVKSMVKFKMVLQVHATEWKYYPGKHY